MSHLKTNASTSTGDNSSLALQGEQAHQARVLRGSGVVMDKVSSFVNGVSRHDGRKMDRVKISDYEMVWYRAQGAVSKIALEVSESECQRMKEEKKKSNGCHSPFIYI